MYSLSIIQRIRDLQKHFNIKKKNREIFLVKLISIFFKIWKIILFLLIIPLILLLFLSRNYFRTTNLFHIIFPIFFMQRIFDNFIFIIGLGVIFFIDPLKLNAQDEGKRKVNRSRNKPGYRFSCNHINNGCFATIWCRRFANIDSVERSKQGGKIGKPVVFARGRREKSTRRGR